MTSIFLKTSDSNYTCFTCDERSRCFCACGSSQPNASTFQMQRQQQQLIPFTSTAAALPNNNNNGNNDNTGEDDVKNASTILAQEMNKLSIEERETVYEDIHGVGNVIEENDELITSALEQFNIELDKIKDTNEAYLLAEQLSKDYVTDPQFQLMFLRSCRFDPILASYKFVRHFELKLQLFPSVEKLTKSITLQDLNDEDMNCLISGRCQLLPYRDRAGRAILGHFSKTTTRLKSVDSMLRAIWYVVMSTIENDIETQKNGLVMIFYAISSYNKPDPMERQLVVRASQFPHSLPYRTVCGHICFEKARLVGLFVGFVKQIFSSNKVRMKFHSGTHTEIQFALMTYGIPLHVFPITNKGNLRNDNLLKWIQRRRIIEETSLSVCFKGIDLPTKHDILLGRGRPLQRYIGNEKFREILIQYKNKYDQSTRRDKPIVADSIVQHMQQKIGSRFLKQNPKDGSWYEVSNDIAREKVCAGFRSLRSDDDKIITITAPNGVDNSNNDDDGFGTTRKRMKI